MMSYRVRQRGMLLFLIVFLAAVVALLEREAYYRIQRNDGYMENISFVLGNSASEQEIFCFTDEEEQTSYFFLPSYAKKNEVRISFAGADTVVFAGEKGDISLVNGARIDALDYNEKYQLYFCDRRGKQLEKQAVVIMHSAEIPAVFLETDSGSMKKLDADKNYAEKGGSSCSMRMAMLSARTDWIVFPGEEIPHGLTRRSPMAFG